MDKTYNTYDEETIRNTYEVILKDSRNFDFFIMEDGNMWDYEQYGFEKVAMVLTENELKMKDKVIGWRKTVRY